MITIYDKNGNSKISVPISDKCVYYKGVMEEEYVNLVFNHHELLQLANGDYIDSEHGRFEIVDLSLPEDKTSSDGGFAFEQHFNPHWWRATHFKLFYNRQAGYEASWKMTHYAYYFMDIVVDNLKRAGIGEYTYVIDASLSEMRLVTFDGVDIISGLTLIAEAWETEWWFADNVIHLGRCEYGEPVRMGHGEELTEVEPEDSSDTDYATRLYIFGAARNLPQNYRRDESTDLVVEGVVERRLKLPEGIDHIDAWSDLSQDDIVEAIITTDEIYPRRTGTIDSITTKEYTDTIENEDGTTTETKWNAFRFTDTGITFSEEYIIAGEELRITFQSGKLAGMDFAVTFNPDAESDEQSDEAQVWEIVRNDDYGVNLPTDDFAPEEGDTYILYGYDTSFVADHLLTDAEQELLDFGTEKIKKLSQVKSNYNCTTNPVRCAGYTPDSNGTMQYNVANVIDLDIGARVEVAHSVYFPKNAHSGRIRSFEKRLDNRYICTYSVGETKGYSRTGQLADKVEALTYQSKQYLIGGAGSSVYLIKRQDSTAASEHNAYSALRSRLEFMCRSVAEYVRTRWSFLKGITVGSFASGSAGAQIDADGNAEVGNLTLRGNAAVGGNITADGNATAKQLTATASMVTPRLSTPDYRSGGLTGEGAAIYTDDEGLTHGEFDHIIARRGLTLTTLTIEEVRSVGGGFVASKGEGEVEAVETYYGDDGSLRYTIYLKDVCKFVLHDYVRYARYDHTNNSYRWAWARVRGCNADIRVINLWDSDLTDGMTPPQPGDILVQMGNAIDTSRQGFVYITPEGVQCYDGVNTTSLVGKCRGVFGDLTGITDGGKALSGYGVWTDKLYIGTGKTAYETFVELYNSIAATDSALAVYKTEVESRFEVVEGSLSSVQKSVTSLQTGGGRNLLLQTNQGVTGWLCHTNAAEKPYISADSSSGVNAVSFDYANGNASSTYEIYSFALRPEYLVAGRAYTLSVEVNCIMGGGISLILQIANNDGSSYLINSRYFTTQLVDEQWTRLTITFTPIASGESTGKQRVRFAVPPDNYGTLAWIAFRNLKLEEGEVATAYSPAPEDYVDTEISAVRTSITTIEQTTDSISARVEEVNTTLDGKISSNTSKISQNSSAITSEVTARTEGDSALASSIEQSASNISLKLSQMSLSNINHAIGTDTPFKMSTGFGNIANQTKKLYDVTGLATGDKVSLSCYLRLKGIVWGDNAFISIQLSDTYGYMGWGFRITEAYLADNGITADEDGYYNIRIQGTGATVGKNSSTGSNAVAADVGYVYIRMDYLSAEEDADALVEVSNLKIEIGDAITAWTARTGDLDEALIDTGIDISRRLIKATADNFKILNNLGAVTMEVDADGNLTANAVLVRNLDSATAKYTPYLTAVNLVNGYIQLYYPLDHDNGNDNISLQIGWDESSSSVFRFFGKDGAMAWKAGSQAALIDTALSTETTITPVDLYKCAGTSLASASIEIKTVASLPATRIYKKVVQTAGAATTTYYTNAACTVAADGYFTEAGLPQLALATDASEDTTYSRRLFQISAGSMNLPQFVTWKLSDNLITQ